MSSDLVERLRKNSSEFSLMWNAADRIEALEGECARLLGLQAEDQQSITDLKVYIRQADARAERLRVALEKIAEHEPDATSWSVGWARKALEDDKQ